MRAPLVLAACLGLAGPAAAATGAAATAAVATPRQQHTINLANGKLDGRVVLGLTPAQVRTRLGKPDSAHGSKARYVLSWGTDATPRFLVIFTKQGTRERAVTLAFETGVYLDPRIGDILRPAPASFLTAMRTQYGDIYELASPLKHKPGRIYSGEFRRQDGMLHVSFGTHAALGTFVTVWRAPTVS